MERETGIEPVTCSPEGRDVPALRHRAQGPERSVSRYRVVAGAHAPIAVVTMAAVAAAGPWHDARWIAPAWPDPLYLGGTMAVGGRL